jgi:molecular chaperone DnaJ
MADKRDYWSCIPKTTASMICESVPQLARKYHPDVTKEEKGHAEEREEMSEAYEVLVDADKHKLYDQYGHAGWGLFSGSGRSGLHACRRHQGYIRRPGASA